MGDSCPSLFQSQYFVKLLEGKYSAELEKSQGVTRHTIQKQGTQEKKKGSMNWREDFC